MLEANRWAIETADLERRIMVLEKAKAMNRFLAEFSKHLAADEHALISLDQAGWHGAKALQVPAHITLVMGKTLQAFNC